MKKTIALQALLLAAVLILTALSGASAEKNPIEGTWNLTEITGISAAEKEEVAGELNAGGYAQYIFDGNRFTMIAQLSMMQQNLTGTYQLSDGKLIVTIDGQDSYPVDYEVNGDTLKINVSVGIWLVFARGADESGILADYLSEIYPSSFERYEGNEGDSCVFNLDGKGLSMRGQYFRNGNHGRYGDTVFENGFEVWMARWNDEPEISWVRTEYDLEGKYELLLGLTDLIKSYNTTDFDTTIYFYDGDRLLTSYRMTPDSYSYVMEVNVEGVDKLTMLVRDNKAVQGGTSFALFELRLLPPGY